MNLILAFFGKTLSPLWSAVAEIGAVVAAVLLAWWAFAGHYEAKGAAKVRAQIDAPVTGWAARLATCLANGATLKAAVDHQNAAVAAAAASYAEMQSRVAKASSAAQAASAAADKRVAAILARKPKDASCEAAHAMAVGQ